MALYHKINGRLVEIKENAGKKTFEVTDEDGKSFTLYYDEKEKMTAEKLKKMLTTRGGFGKRIEVREV